MMFDTLLAFGCSHTQGDESLQDYNTGVKKEENIFHSYPYFLSEHLKCKRYYNYACTGASNQEIASTVLSRLKEHKDKRVLVVIGWTEYNRICTQQHNPKTPNTFEKIINNQPIIKRIPLIKRFLKKEENRERRIITITRGLIRVVMQMMYGCRLSPDDKVRRFNKEYYEREIKPHYNDEFILGVEKHIFDTRSLFETNVYIRACTEMYLTKENIPYIAFPLMNVPKTDIDYLLEGTSNILPINKVPKDVSFVERYGKRYGMSTGGGHMKREAHKHFARFLYKKILTVL